MKYKQGPHKKLVSEKAPKHLSPSVAAKGGVIGAMCVVNTPRNEPRAHGAERPAAPLGLSSYFFPVEKDLPHIAPKALKVPPRQDAEGMESPIVRKPKAQGLPKRAKEPKAP